MKPPFGLAAALLVLLTTASCSVLFKRSPQRQSLLLKGQDGMAGAEADIASDSESLLGKYDAKTFEQLQPKEKRQRLSDLVSEKIDQDRDGFVTHAELLHWLSFVWQRHMQEDSKQQWDKLNVTGLELIWAVYRIEIYGKEEEGPSSNNLLQSIIAQDHRRFKAANVDSSAGLTFDEFISFCYPEEFAHMKSTVMLDAMDDVDSNRDGFVDESEYIGAMWQNQLPEEEPEWVSKERLLYRRGRDIDQDGKLNPEEVQRWAAPLDHNRSHAESQHLMLQSDVDKDGKLTVVEILNKFDVFVQSEATNYGEDLVGQHDEL